MTEGVFRWLQPFAVKVSGMAGMAPEQARPVLAVTEEGTTDPLTVRVILITTDDAGRLRRVNTENCEIAGVGSWSQLLLLSQKAQGQPSGQILTPVQVTPEQLQRLAGRPGPA